MRHGQSILPGTVPRGAEPASFESIEGMEYTANVKIATFGVDRAQTHLRSEGVGLLRTALEIAGGG